LLKYFTTEIAEVTENGLLVTDNVHLCVLCALCGETGV